MIPGFPTRIDWIETEEPTSAFYAISYEAMLAEVYASHPDWLAMLRLIDGRTLMTDERFSEILSDQYAADHRRLGRRWRR